jgi:hypothetical protein
MTFYALRNKTSYYQLQGIRVIVHSENTSHFMVPCLENP